MTCPNFLTCKQACHELNYCIKEEFPVVTLAEIREQTMVRNIRQTCRLVAQEENLKPSQWREWLANQNRDYNGTFLDSFGLPKHVDLEFFDATDKQIDNGEAEKVEETLREFFRANTCHPPTKNGNVFITKPWLRHAAALGSIVGAVRPDQSMKWPRLRVGHSNWRLKTAANDNCPPF